MPHPPQPDKRGREFSSFCSAEFSNVQKLSAACIQADVHGSHISRPKSVLSSLCAAGLVYGSHASYSRTKISKRFRMPRRHLYANGMIVEWNVSVREIWNASHHKRRNALTTRNSADMVTETIKRRHGQVSREISETTIVPSERMLISCYNQAPSRNSTPPMKHSTLQSVIT